MHETLGKLERELADGLSGLSREQTQVPRAPEKWTIQQIVEHLLMTYRSTSGVFEVRIAKGTPTLSRPNLQQKMGIFLITTLKLFPKGHLAPEIACPPVIPVELRSGAELTEQVAAELARMDALMAEAKRIFGVRRCVSHARLGAMSVGQWRRFHLVHGEHHLKQVLATRVVLGV